MAPMTRKRQAAQDAANATAAKAVRTEHGEAAHKPELAALSDDEASIITSETPVAGHEQLDVHVEHAKSGRSQCRVCKGEINKGEVRIGSAWTPWTVLLPQGAACLTPPSLSFLRQWTWR